MRKTALSIALSLTCVGLASAWSTSNDAPEARAFAALSFGESARSSSANQFFYGMRLDQSYQSRLEGRPALAQLHFDRHGFNEARVNGMPFAYTVRLAQTEGGEGGEPGTFSNFTIVDWTLLAVGAVAIGYGISEVVDQEDTPDPSGGGTTTGGATTGGDGGTTGTPLGGLLGGGTTGTPLGGLLGGGTTGTPTGGTTTGGTPTGGLLGGLLGTFRTTTHGGLAETRNSAEYQEWLDGGTGQMGDLSAR